MARETHKKRVTVTTTTTTCDVCGSPTARSADGEVVSGRMRVCKVCGCDACYWHTHSQYVADLDTDGDVYDYDGCSEVRHYDDYCLPCWEAGKRQRKAIAKLRAKSKLDLELATCVQLQAWGKAAHKAKKAHAAPDAEPWDWEAEVALRIAECTTTSTTDEAAELFDEAPAEETQ